MTHLPPLGQILIGTGITLLIVCAADCFADRAHILAALRNRLNPPDHSADKLADRGGGVGLNHGKANAA